MRTVTSDRDWREPPVADLTPILQAAADAFFEAGYHGTSVRDIARRVGLTVPALYYHHDNKEALLAALLDDAIELVIRRCQDAVAAAGDDPLLRFRYLVEALVLHMTQVGKRAAMHDEIRSLGPANRAAYSAKRRVIETLVVSTIEDGVNAGLFDVSVVAETARALLGMIQAIAIWYRPEGALDPAGVAASYVDIAEHVVGYRPSASHSALTD